MAHYGKLASTFSNVAASSTDSNLVTGITNRIIRVYGVVCVCGATATTIVFNSATGGSGGVAKSATFANGANGGVVMPYSEAGWFETNAGDYLTCTTGSGSTTGVHILYGIESSPGATS